MLGRALALDRIGLVPPHFLLGWDHRDDRAVDQVMGAFLMIPPRPVRGAARLRPALLRLFRGRGTSAPARAQRDSPSVTWRRPWRGTPARARRGGPRRGACSIPAQRDLICRQTSWRRDRALPDRNGLLRAGAPAPRPRPGSPLATRGGRGPGRRRDARPRPARARQGRDRKSISVRLKASVQVTLWACPPSGTRSSRARGSAVAQPLGAGVGHEHVVAGGP